MPFVIVYKAVLAAESVDKYSPRYHNSNEIKLTSSTFMRCCLLSCTRGRFAFVSLETNS